MKYPKLLIVALAALALGLVGCSKDEPSGPAPLTGEANPGSGIQPSNSPGGAGGGPDSKATASTDK